MAGLDLSAPRPQRGAPPGADLVITCMPKFLSTVELPGGGCALLATSGNGLQVSIPMDLHDRLQVCSMLRGQVPSEPNDNNPE